MNEIIKIENVSKKFKEHQVIENVNISFEAGKIHGLIGRNGSGKTVLIKMICGFIQPDTGRIIVSGKQIGKDIDFPQNVGAIIEAPGFLAHISAYKNLEYLASLRSIIGKNEIRNAISLVGLNPDEKKPVGKYSLGMKQRLGLAQAIMEDPEILILDEPMNGLDKDGVSEMRELLLKFKEMGKTILIVSHNSEDIRLLCDTVHEIDKGKITEQH